MKPNEHLFLSITTDHVVSHSFYAKVSNLHTELYKVPASAMANPLVAFTLIKRLHSEWLNVVYSDEALENTQGWVLSALQTHLLVITKQPLFSAVITQPPQFTFWPSAVQPSGRVTRRKRQIFPNWKTSKGPLRGWWDCRMYMLSKLRASWGAVSRESLMASPLISTCPQCLSHCLVMTAFWLERYTSHYFPLLLLNWIRSTKKYQYNNLKILHFK